MGKVIPHETSLHRDSFVDKTHNVDALQPSPTIYNTTALDREERCMRMRKQFYRANSVGMVRRQTKQNTTEAGCHRWWSADELASARSTPTFTSWHTTREPWSF